MAESTAKPTNKVAASGLAGAVTVLIAWALKEFGGIELPAGIESAFTVVVSFATGYLVPNATEESPPFDKE